MKSRLTETVKVVNLGAMLEEDLQQVSGASLSSNVQWSQLLGVLFVYRSSGASLPYEKLKELLAKLGRH